MLVKLKQRSHVRSSPMHALNSGISGPDESPGMMTTI